MKVQNIFNKAFDLWCNKYNYDNNITIESIMSSLVESGEYTKEDLDEVNHQFDLAIEAGIAYEEDVKEALR